MRAKHLNLDKYRSAYLIGIGGAGMSALAQCLQHYGLEISGSDLKASTTTERLSASGIKIFIGQNEVHYCASDLIIYSSAIHPEHIELRTARDQSLAVFHRAEVLSHLFNRAKTSIAVAGTHGKTTTSSMIAYLLDKLGQNPTALIGGDMLNYGSNSLLGSHDLFVSEVDESDRSHELYHPHYGVITNLEEDHMDQYKNLADIRSSFERYVDNFHTPGLIVYSEHDPVLMDIVPQSGKPCLSIGFSDSADFAAKNVQLHPAGSTFELYECGLYAGQVTLSVPGIHNISNAMGALAVLSQIGADLDAAMKLIRGFAGAKRRLEVKWHSSDIWVIDDYAHHPTEVTASIRALKSYGHRVTVIFQPHRYSRTAYFSREFGKSLSESDEVILTDIYSAGEKNKDNTDIETILTALQDAGHTQVSRTRKNDIIEYLLQKEDLHGVVAFIGAGDIGEIASEFANRIKSHVTA